jgi:hypothetical protein
MRAKPCDQVIPEEEAGANFDSIRKVVNGHPSVIPQLAQYREEGTKVTDQMREIRKTNVARASNSTLRTAYKINRFGTQRKLKLIFLGNHRILMWVFQAVTMIFALTNSSQVCRLTLSV